MPSRKRDLEKLHKDAQEQRARMQRKTAIEVDRLLKNPDGLARLRDIGDEEWEAAARSDIGDEGAA